VWRRADGGDRLRLRLIHPMNTGFVSGIPAFFIDHLEVKTPDGRTLAEFDPAEPVAENPTLTVDLTGSSPGGYVVEWHDTDGNTGRAAIAPASQTLAEEVAK
jgi:sulfur-oxidizing protein SoxY